RRSPPRPWFPPARDWHRLSRLSLAGAAPVLQGFLHVAPYVLDRAAGLVPGQPRGAADLQPARAKRGLDIGEVLAAAGAVGFQAEAVGGLVVVPVHAVHVITHPGVDLLEVADAVARIGGFGQAVPHQRAGGDAN